MTRTRIFLVQVESGPVPFLDFPVASPTGLRVPERCLKSQGAPIAKFLGLRGFPCVWDEVQDPNYGIKGPPHKHEDPTADDFGIPSAWASEVMQPRK